MDADFAVRLTGIVAKEMVAGRREPERMSAALEGMLRSTAFMISIMSGGDPKVASTLLEGSIAYLTDTTTGFGPLSQLFAEPEGD